MGYGKDTTSHGGTPKETGKKERKKMVVLHSPRRWIG